MENLLDICSVNDHINNNTFVGIKFENEKFSVHFPLGFHLENARKDILLLISVLKKYAYIFESEETSANPLKAKTGFPLLAYQYVINDFVNKGYYYERESNFKQSQQGNINWKKTIKNINPVVYNGRLGYMDFYVKNIDHSKETVITLIHEYCVYESVKWLGWIYNLPLPQRPRLTFNKKLFLSSIDEKLKNTFSDTTKELLLSMKAIILSLNDDGKTIHKNYFGTNRFEYVWEKMIDQVYGIKDKQKYFPNTYWKIKGSSVKTNSPLEPDTIMLNAP
ncbi:LlaJI family restriction endonuclease [Faecalibacillus faecis]|uniref:LlaJI family restriction endonuclease n=1 Tax=Faecalibacillus faecis TaxID=1982628 RepID=UPI00386B87A7